MSMEIKGPGPTGGIIRTGRVTPRRAIDGEATSAPSAPRRINDSADVMGIPEPELTPKVRQALMTLMGEVHNLRDELEATKARLPHVERLADMDTLTPIANRRAFVRELHRAISLSERYGDPASVLYFDLNGFKEINDTYGHAAGDAALLHVTDILLRHVRESDVVGRLGGDEFGVILNHTDAAATKFKADELLDDIGSSPLTWEGEEIPIEIAYGAYAFKDGEDAERALAEADRAMYAEKIRMKGNNAE